jgi:glycosyltransferase involved in cell wall biosynthesis
LRIALDATYSLGPNLSGVGVYSREILRGLAAAHPETGFDYCYRPHRFVRSWSEEVPKNARRRLLIGGAPRASLFHALNQRVDLRFGPVVTTFHDLFVLTAEYSTREFRERFAEQARNAARRSDRIIAVSEFTARQVVDLLGFDRSRIDVVPHGTHAPPAILPDSERENLVLFLGSIQKRKNVVRLVRAFRAMPSGWKLVLAGGTGFGAEEALDAIRESPRRDDISTPGYISAAELETLYRRARIFAFPSLDEGFGIPVLEAMAWGVPVLTSNRSALPEAAGDAAQLVDPNDEDAMADALQRLAVDRELREQLQEQGRERALAHPWSRACDETWNVYRKLLPDLR